VGRQRVVFVTIADTWLPIAAACSAVRIDTGIIAISGLSGNASWSTSQRRSAPAQIAITTSLTVQPYSSLTFFTLFNDTEP
jgi:hypothetical protein